LNQLDDKLWKLFSKWTRLLNADDDGWVNCYTCGKKAHYKEMQAGHYLKSSYKGVKFDPQNVKPQCARCNLYLNGFQSSFAIHLEQEYGSGILQALEQRKFDVITRLDYMKMIEFYKHEVDNLLLKKWG
jgi:hypothetical protein